MVFNGVEIYPYASNCTPQAFNPPREMVVWDAGREYAAKTELVYAYLPERIYPVQCADAQYTFCADPSGMTAHGLQKETIDED